MPRAPSCCTIPTPAIHYMPGRDIVEVLTKCRAEHLVARQGSLCCRGSENQKDNRFGESPISGLLAKSVVAILK
jgi:hypothetical protein